MTIEGHESSNMYSMYSNLNCWTVVEICVCQLNKTPYTEDWKFQFISISLKKKNRWYAILLFNTGLVAGLLELPGK